MAEEITMNELMEFLQENMVTRVDLNNAIDGLRTELKTEMEEMRSEMRAGFREMKAELEDIKKGLERLETKVQDDSNALTFELEKLKKRVFVLEEVLKVKNTKTA